MNLLDVLGILDQIPERLEDTLSSAADHHSRSPRLARLLHECCPWASFTACLLDWGDRSHLGTFAENNGVPAGWIEGLQSGVPASRADRQSAWESLLSSAGHSAVVQTLAASGQSYGLVALRIAGGLDSLEVRSAATILRSFSRTLSLLLLAEVLGCDGRQTREELREQERLANTGELAGAVAHEFTNFLNLLLLHVSMLEYQLPQKDHADLAEIRRQGNEAAEVVRQFQDYRRGQSPAPRLVNLNEVLTEVAAELTHEPPPPSTALLLAPDSSATLLTRIATLRLALAEDLPPIRSTRPEVLRLARFLIGNALRAAGEQGEVGVRTSIRKGGVLLEIEDSGAQVSEDKLPYLFDPARSQRAGVELLELAACRSLVRRLRGSLHAENRSEGGIRVVVELPGERGG